MTDEQHPEPTLGYGQKLQLANYNRLTRYDRAEVRTYDGQILRTWYATDGKIDIPPFEDFLPPRFRGQIIAIGDMAGQKAQRVVLEWESQ